MIRSKYILILLMVLTGASASAQNSQVMYFMNLPQNHLVNPAFRPSNSVYVGIPVVSGVTFNVNNNFVNFNDIFMKGQSSDSVITFLHPDNNIDDFLAKIKEKNYVNAQVAVNLFSLGFNVGRDGYFFVDVNERTEGDIVLPGDLFTLAFKGNEGFAGRTINLSSLNGFVRSYNELGIGYSKVINNRLRVGARGRLLSGIADASIVNKSLSLAISNDYTHTLNTDVRLNISAPVTVTTDENGNISGIEFNKSSFDKPDQALRYIFGGQNIGLGVDIGAEYALTDRINISGALIDLGYIRWSKDVTNLVLNTTFEYSGLDMKDVINGTKTINEVGNEMVDSLNNSLKVSQSNNPYTTFLPFGVNLGGSYALTRNLSLGLLSYTRIIGNHVREAATFSANLNLSNILSTSLCYTLTNNQYDNLGAGIAVRGGPFQLYLLAERIPLSWNRINIENSPVPLPETWQTISWRFGINLTFGNKVKMDKDKPMVTVE